jgi:type II secretory pathway predicted ATPase ExeA
MADERGIGLLHGPESSGKSELIERFIQELQPTVAVAVVDGARLKTPQLLEGILEQFGYRVELNSTDELLNMLRVIIVQQTRSHISPVLIVQNINHMYPSALCVLCKLAAQKVHSRFALRIVLVGDRIFRRIISSPSMRSIADRLVGDFALEALPEPELPKLIVTLNGETL